MPAKNLILLVMLSGCAAEKKPKAHLVIPPECVQEIRAVNPIEIDNQGKVIGKSEFKIKYNCTKVDK